jgi:hypothetical protein
MAEKLYESDFLTVNLSKIFKGKSAPTGAKSGIESTTSERADQDLEIRGDMPWEEWLKRKQEENKKLPKEQQLSEYAVETEVFKEFYNEEWGNDADLTKKLLDIGDLLRKAFKVLHFNAPNNPFYNFLKGGFGKDLVKKDLLNASTFKAIFTAVQKKQVVTSEFREVFDGAKEYNILYCTNLYKKSPDKITEYLDLQSKILSPSATEYTAKDKLKNKQVFIRVSLAADPTKDDKSTKAYVERLKKYAAQIAGKSVQEAELNSIETASKIYNMLNGRRVEDDVTSVGDEAQKSIVSKINSSAEIFAALQLLNTYSSSATIQKILSIATNHQSVSSLRLADINAVQPVVAKIIPAGKINTKDAVTIANALLNKLQGKSK